jgi:parvulin-like peptidyl-prolyl isomerase
LILFKEKKVKRLNSAIFLIAILFLTGLAVSAQETELKVVDEVVAQVNENVVTLSGIKREMKEIVALLIESGKTREQAEAEVESRKAELIANFINEELLIQKGKELGIETDVDAEINARLGQKMKEMNLKSIDKLYEAMRNAGLDPDQIRDTWRKQLTRDFVLQREVDSKVYFGWSSKEVKDYYEKNKSKFVKPETVSLSEIFLSFAGRDEAAVKEKANQLIKQAREGADFVKLVMENSERDDKQQSKGSVGKFTYDQLKDINEKLVAPVKATKTGAVTDAIVLDEGVEILRVDERTAASSESVFDETEVRRVMTVEQIPAERKKYMIELRDPQQSYIKINETYRPMVAPLLFAEERKTDDKKTNDKKNNDKKSNK